MSPEDHERDLDLIKRALNLGPLILAELVDPADPHAATLAEEREHLAALARIFRSAAVSSERIQQRLVARFAEWDRQLEQQAET